MCSGIRDAANLTFKLDLVLQGLAHPDLLDSYGSERSAHVQHAIGLSVELGKIICVTDATAVAERDSFMIGLGADPDKILPALPPASLTNGLVQQSIEGLPTPGAGTLAAQGHVTYRGRTGLLDAVVGTGFILASTHDVRSVLTAEHESFLESIGLHILRLVPTSDDVTSTDDAVDVDGIYLPHLAAAGHVAALVRPDHYVFGTAHTVSEIPGLIDDLRRQMGTDRTQANSSVVVP